MNNFCKLCLKCLIYFYKLCCSPFLASTCRFTPSCSQYALDSIEKYALSVALCKIIYRILRCNPFCKGGVDNA